MPFLDSHPVCAALLDPPAGGFLLLAPNTPYEVDRAYIPGTTVLHSTYRTAGGAVEVVDSLNVGTSGPLPWTELARRVRGSEGQVEMTWEFVPGTRFGEAEPRCECRAGIPLAFIDDVCLAVLTDRLEQVQIDTGAIRGEFLVRADDDVLLAIVASRSEPVFIPPISTINARIERTIATWRRWTEHIEHNGDWEHWVVRSALTLKTLLCEPSDAIAAAGTTSLPERIGGDKNWDYRFAWVRDSSFTVNALINLELHEEVHAAVSWLLAAIKRSRPDLRVFYTLAGTAAGPSSTLDAPGYRGSQPVRRGNDAARQRQLGNYGDLFDTIFRYTESGHLIDKDSAQCLCELADRCCENWRKKDSGIWELSKRRHYTISKIACWVALDRATRLARAGQLPPDQEQRWQREADEIHQWILEHCWSDTLHAYTFYADNDQLDASVLLAGRTGFDCGPRLSSTIDVITDQLGIPGTPLLYRYTGMDQEEGAFVACTFWVVDALARTGQLDRARDLMNQAVAICNELGLLSEQVDPTDNSFLGNFPQGLSHLSLINAAATLSRAGSSTAASAVLS